MAVTRSRSVQRDTGSESPVIDTTTTPSRSQSRARSRTPSATTRESRKTKKAAPGKTTWGRHSDASMVDVATVSLIFVFAPILVSYFVVACDKYQCAISGPAMDLWSNMSLSEFWETKVTKPTVHSYKIYVAWLAFQAFLALFVPGPVGYGQVTPAGHKLKYNVNGLNCWVVTHILFFVCTYYLDLFKPTIIFDNWPQIVWAMHTYGYLLTFFCFAKAYIAPTYPDDNKVSTSHIYNMFMGIECNPRIGNLDFKLFHNGRIGIILWTLINLSFAAKQYELYGHVTNSMVLLNLFHALYVLDFFYNEDWYLRTIDICHDHFGFYLAWGDAVWLPVMYTLQGYYLVQNPVQLAWPWAAAIFALCAGGYYIFRSVNEQKDRFRMDPENCIIWGKPATYIKAQYTTADGDTRTSHLLTSGWWGISRHANYLGDLMMSLAFCLTCGFQHILPYFYIIYMSILLGGRVFRDETKCQAKYGKYWDQYTRAVPYRYIPGVW